VSTTKRLLKGITHQAMRTPIGEDLVRALNRRAPQMANTVTRRLASPPPTYGNAGIRRAHSDGFTWNLRPSDYFQWHHFLEFPDPVLDAMRALVGSSDVVLDIGANIGLYAVVLARQTQRVFAFEPHPDTFARLREHASLNATSNLEAVNLAFGMGAGPALLADGGRGDSGKFTLRAIDLPSTSNEQHTVDTDTVDGFVSARGLSHVDFVKIDVEGHEPEVLLGARDTLTRLRPRMLVEFTPRWYADRWPRFVESLDLVESLYDLYEIDGRAPLLRIHPTRIARMPGDARQRNVIAIPRGVPLPGALASRLETRR
jgi:FkbM family methyltransferase